MASQRDPQNNPQGPVPPPSYAQPGPATLGTTGLTGGRQIPMPPAQINPAPAPAKPPNPPYKNLKNGR